MIVTSRFANAATRTPPAASFRGQATALGVGGDPRALLIAAVAAEDLGSQLTSCAEAIDTVRRGLASSWEGAAATAFSERYAIPTAADLRTAATAANEIGYHLRTAAATITQAQERIAELTGVAIATVALGAVFAIVTFGTSEVAAAATAAGAAVEVGAIATEAASALETLAVLIEEAASQFVLHATVNVAANSGLALPSNWIASGNPLHGFADQYPGIVESSLLAAALQTASDVVPLPGLGATEPQWITQPDGAPLPPEAGGAVVGPLVAGAEAEAAASPVSPGDLSAAGQSNYGRFLKSLPAGANESTITQLPDGSFQFDANVPASNIPGSYVTYTKVVSPEGNTVTFYKTTYAQDGSVVHVKVKYP